MKILNIQNRRSVTRIYIKSDITLLYTLDSYFIDDWYN